MKSKMSSILVNALSEISRLSKRKIIALKGFNYWVDEISSDVDLLFGARPILPSDVSEILKVLDSKLSTGETYYCLLEDLIMLSNLQLTGVIKAKQYCIECINNNVFPNVYPSFPIEQSQFHEQLIRGFESVADNEIQKYYAEVHEGIKTDYIVYGDTGLDEIKRIDVTLFFSNIALSDEESVVVFEDIDRVEFSQLVLEMLEVFPTKIILERGGRQKGFVNSTLDFFEKLGVQVFDNGEHANTMIPASVFEEILHRKNPSYKFKDLKVYSDPFQSNETKIISQVDIIQEIASNIELACKGEQFRDVFVTAPTGAGKSIIFQIPAIHLAEKYNAVTLVITPLIGLMNDQVANINDMTSVAATINSDFTPSEKERIKETLQNGEKSILYVSPETLLANTDINSLIGDRKLGLLVVDEAHIVCTWGKSFRPDYWFLGDYIYRLRKSGEQNFPIVALTATATIGGSQDMYSDIVDSLRMTPKSYFGYVKRDDISFDIIEHDDPSEYDAEKVKTAIATIERLQRTGKKVLVYFPYKKQIEEIHDKLRCKSRVGKYYGSLPSNEKNETLRAIKTGEINVILATKAFGMGIDIDDIEYVYHYAPTGTLTDYVQEIGRSARRNDLSGVACTDYFNNDFKYIKQLEGLSRVKPYEVLGVIQKLLELRRRNGSQNFMVAPEEFAYLLSSSGKGDDREINARLKSVLLIIKTDFELDSSIGYPPIIFKPQSMFTKGYFIVNDDYIDELKAQGVYKHFKKQSGQRTALSGGTTRTQAGDLYQLDFGKLWEEKYRDMSFGNFKWRFFSNQLDGFNYKVYNSHFHEHPVTPKKLIPKIVIEIDSAEKEKRFGKIISIITQFFDEMTKLYDEMKFAGKYFSTEEMAQLILKKVSYVSSLNNKYVAEMVALNITHMLGKVCEMNDFPFKFYSFRDNKLIISKRTYESAFHKLRRALFELLKDKDAYHCATYLTPGAKQDELKLVIVQIIQMLDLATCTIMKGTEPEFFVRINSTRPLQKILDNPYYSSDTIQIVRESHLRSCDLMKHFFTELESDEDRWSFIEDYFLGRDLLETENIE